MMHIKSHQKKAFSTDLKRTIIFQAILTFVFAQSLIKVQQSVLGSIVTFIVFVALTAPFVLSANPTLVKLLRSDLQKSLKSFILLVSALFILSCLYAAATNQFSSPKVLAGGVWLVISTIMLFFLRRREAPAIIDYVYVIVLCVPIEFSLIGGMAVPPGAAIVQPFSVISLLLLIFSYLVVREFEVGFSFHLKGDDFRIVVLDFLLFFFIAVIVGMLTGVLSVSDRLPSLGQMVSQLVFIFFFIAIPEELLFRGVIYRLLVAQFKGRPYAVGKALAVSSILFGLANGGNSSPPFIAIHLGVLGTWQAPWAFMLLATIAGAFYGLVFIRTKNIIAAAAIHLLVDWSWFVFFSGK